MQPQAGSDAAILGRAAPAIGTTGGACALIKYKRENAMSFTQLAPPLPVFVTGKGKAMAVGVIDHGPGHSLVWVTALEDGGEISCAPNDKIRLCASWPDARPKGGRHGELGIEAADGDSVPARRSDLRALHIPDADAEYSAFP
jgi:hypothetical protein